MTKAITSGALPPNNATRFQPDKLDALKLLITRPEATALDLTREVGRVYALYRTTCDPACLPVAIDGAVRALEKKRSGHTLRTAGFTHALARRDEDAIRFYVESLTFGQHRTNSVRPLAALLAISGRADEGLRRLASSWKKPLYLDHAWLQMSRNLSLLLRNDDAEYCVRQARAAPRGVLVEGSVKPNEARKPRPSTSRVVQERDQFLAAVQRDRTDVSALVGLARAELALGHGERAEVFVTTALDQAPDDLRALALSVEIAAAGENGEETPTRAKRAADAHAQAVVPEL